MAGQASGSPGGSCQASGSQLASAAAHKEWVGEGGRSWVLSFGCHSVQLGVWEKNGKEIKAVHSHLFH